MADFFTSEVDEIDFDRAASAFPDISLDGDGEIPVPLTSVRNDSTASFSFDEPIATHNVKVTGDDEFEKFQTEFPDIQVCLSRVWSTPVLIPYPATTPFRSTAACLCYYFRATSAAICIFVHTYPESDG